MRSPDAPVPLAPPSAKARQVDHTRATLAEGVPLGVAYGIWAAAGVAIMAVLSKILFKEPLNWLMGLGILIVGGVLHFELGAAH